jgi:hypothetical protein
MLILNMYTGIVPFYLSDSHLEFYNNEKFIFRSKEINGNIEIDITVSQPLNEPIKDDEQVT